MIEGERQNRRELRGLFFWPLDCFVSILKRERTGELQTGEEPVPITYIGHCTTCNNWAKILSSLILIKL